MRGEATLEKKFGGKKRFHLMEATIVNPLSHLQPNMDNEFTAIHTKKANKIPKGRKSTAFVPKAVTATKSPEPKIVEPVQVVATTNPLDEIPVKPAIGIQGGPKTFEELLASKLPQENDENDHEPEKTAKKPFLRKGSRWGHIHISAPGENPPPTSKRRSASGSKFRPKSVSHESPSFDSKLKARKVREVTAKQETLEFEAIEQDLVDTLPVQFDDEESWSPNEASDPESDASDDVVETEAPPPPTSSLVNRLFYKQEEPPAPKPKKTDDAKLHKQISDLEHQLHEVKRALSSSEKTRQRLNTEVAKLNNEFNSAMQRADAEIEDLKARHMEDSSKWKREKRNLQTQLRNLSTKTPDRKEREEIEHARAQIHKVMEESRQSTAKAKRTQERHTKEIEKLSTENEQLRIQLRKLEAARIESWEQAKRVEEPQVVVQEEESIVSEHALDSLDQQIFPGGMPSPPSPLSSPLVGDAMDEEEPLQEISFGDGKKERLFDDGRRCVIYTNGTRKTLFPDGHISVQFVNGDVKDTYPDKRVVYFYFEAQTIHVAVSDGSDIFYFANGQIERHLPSGDKWIQFPDGNGKHYYADGTEQSFCVD